LLAAHTDACAATRVRGEQSEEVMELRMECLDRRRQEVSALVEVLTHADAQVAQRAPRAVASLPGLDECKNADALRQVVPPPATPQAHQRVAALRTRLAEATARKNAGRFAEALKLAESMVRDAQQLGYAPLLAETLTLRGILEADTSHPDAAPNTLLDASVAAEAGHDDHARAEALTQRVFSLRQHSRFAEAHDNARQGRAALARVGGDVKLEMALDQNEATVLFDEGRYDDCLALENQLLPRLEQSFGPDSPRVGRLLQNLGVAYLAKGDPNRAIRYFQRVISIVEKIHGVNHPDVAYAWINIGLASFDKGDYHGALEAGERALPICEAVFGPDNADTATVLSNMGIALMKLNQAERALTLIERARTIHIRAFGPDHPVVAMSECRLADVLLKLRRTDAALSHAGRCLAIRERVLGADHPHTADALTMEGKCRLAQKNAAQAIQPLEHAVVLLEHRSADLSLLPQARFALAQALWSAGRDRPRALSLAQAAHQWEPIRPEVDAWLAKHL
jgi:tetratricopeptide (TPR) repeat protein